MRFAYADPPYLGWAKRYYGDQHAHAGEYDHIDAHRALITRLSADFDGWALSLQSNALQVMLPLCPPGVRVLSWVKPWCSWKPNVRTAYTWEPIILREGRPRKRPQPTVPDHLICAMTMRKGLRGAKPAKFAFWIFDILNLQPGDEFVDCFPGTGGVGACWRARQDGGIAPFFEFG